MAVMSSNEKASIDAIASKKGRIKENETVCPSWRSRKICCLTSSKSICTSGFQPRNRPSNPAQIYIELIYEICITYVKTNPAPCLQNTEKNLDLAPLEGDLLILRVMQNFGSSCDQ